MGRSPMIYLDYTGLMGMGSAFHREMEIIGGHNYHQPTRTQQFVYPSVPSNVLAMMRRLHDSPVSLLPLLSSNLSISLLSTSRVMNLLSCLVVCVRLLMLLKNLPIARFVTMRFALPPITSIGSVPISSIFVNGPVPLMIWLIWLLGSVGTPMVCNILLSNKWHVSDRR